MLRLLTPRRPFKVSATALQGCKNQIRHFSTQRQNKSEKLLFCHSMPAVKYSQEFTISIVVGKDVVPRIGLHQMESLRADLINAIKRSKDPKVRFIYCAQN
jgi:hypothetical protein